MLIRWTQLLAGVMVLFFVMLGTFAIRDARAETLPDPRNCYSQDTSWQCEVARLKQRAERSERTIASQAEQIRRMQSQIDALMSRVNASQGR
jgi:TolA-binding protein